MAPNTTEATAGVLYENDAATADLGIAGSLVHKADNIKWEYKWHYIAYMVLTHAGTLYGAYLIFVSAKWQTNIFAVYMCASSILGIGAGAHRLWSHKAYKAKWPLRLILAITYTQALQVGWFLVKEHPEFLRKSSEVDLSDLYSDPIVYYQDKYYAVLATLLAIIVPTLLPVYFWNESLTNAFFVTTVFRIAWCIHVTGCINSIAHKWGNKPYDKAIRPTENFIGRVISFGEGSHNYHHTFPWDYKTSDVSFVVDLSTHFIDLCAEIGWAYELKTVSEDIIQKRIRRTGDGSCAGDEAIRINQKTI